MQRVHATCVEIGTAAALLRGPSGCGKSDLALRMIDHGARLVADDYVELHARNRRLYATPPMELAGRLEVRGVGVVRLNHVQRARVGLVVDLVPQLAERMPRAHSIELEGIVLPLHTLAAFEDSAPAKLRLLIRALDHDMIET
jgi:serine kinase of HPr protein (carbohydrate metabolism regulator)